MPSLTCVDLKPPSVHCPERSRTGLQRSLGAPYIVIALFDKLTRSQNALK